MSHDSLPSGVDLPEGTALIVIDVQKGMDEPYWGVRNNPQAEQNMARLLAAWRRRGWAVYHIHHQSKNPQSPLRPNYVGNEIKEIVRPLPGEPVLQKRENSAFVGTDLEARLRAANQRTVVLTGLNKLSTQNVNLPGSIMTLFKKTVKGSLFGDCNPTTDIPRLLDLYRGGGLKLDELITRRYTLDQVNEGYDDLLNGKNVRGVLVHEH